MSVRIIEDAYQLESFCESHSKGEYSNIRELHIQNPAGDSLSRAYSVLAEFHSVHTEQESKQITRAVTGAGTLAAGLAIATGPIAVGVAAAVMIFGGITAAGKKNSAKEKLESTPLSSLAIYLDNKGFVRYDVSVQKIIFRKS